MKRFSVSPALVIALVCIPIFIGALDLTVVSAVLPHVVYDLEIPQTEINSAAWIVSGYLLAYTIAMTFMGRLSDLAGRRKVFLLALVIFAVGSYLVAVSGSWPTHLALRTYYLFFEGRPDPARVSLAILIAARMVQAFGGGAMVPVGMALVGDCYPPDRRARPLGVIAAVDTCGWVVGHLYGGVLTRFFDWRMIFWLNLPVCLIAFILIAYFLRSLLRPPTEGRMDWPGALLISASLTALIVGLGASGTNASTISTADSAPSQVYLPLIVGAALLLALFIFRQIRARSPLVPLSLFRSSNFTLAALANFFIGFALFIAIANVPIFINTLVAQTLTQGAWDSGWMLSAFTVPMAIASVPGGWLASHHGYRLPSLFGLGIALAGFAWMTSWTATTPYLQMIPQLALAGAGFGLTMAPVATAAINTAPSSFRGTASAFVIIFRLIGMTVSVATISGFDQQRFNRLSANLLAINNDLVKAGMDAITLVIRESFWLAVIICAVACLPILFLHSERRIE